MSTKNVKKLVIKSLRIILSLLALASLLFLMCMEIFDPPWRNPILVLILGIIIFGWILMVAITDARKN